MRRGYISLAIGCFLLAFGTVFWHGRDNSDKRVGAGPASPLTPSHSRSISASKSLEAVHASPFVTSKRDTLREVLRSSNDQKIDFYGQVIDQFGVVIPDVKVTGSVIYNNGITSGVTEKHTLTDAEGVFQFKGMKGRTFDYHLEKDGYKTMPDHDAFDYTTLIAEEKRHHPDSSRPVILRMWKLQGAEALFYKDESFNLTTDGTPIRIDLQAGRVVNTGGDLLISVKHPRSAAGTRLDKYAWHAELTAVDGGMIESTERITNMLLAPASGYSSSLSIDVSDASDEWKQHVEKNIYLKSRERVYSRVYVDIQTSSDQPNSYVRLKWWSNPSGSGNLEYDPAKRIDAR